jgi:hypothetical protein
MGHQDDTSADLLAQRREELNCIRTNVVHHNPRWKNRAIRLRYRPVRVQSLQLSRRNQTRRTEL